MPGTGGRGGTLRWLTEKELPTLDPQRVYVGRDIALLGRTVYRSLVQFPVSEDPDEAGTPVPDLATDTGRSSDGARTWTFTLRDDVCWEDGRPVTAADLAHGLSRAFATHELKGGPSFVLPFLDIPRDQAGTPVYAGPYARPCPSGRLGRLAFERAVSPSSDLRSITYRFARPWADFPLAIASLRCFDPYRPDRDRGAASNLDVFSSGPYRLDGSYVPGRGLRLIRNEHWNPATDFVRRAHPDVIQLEEGLSAEEIADRLVEDRDGGCCAVTDRLIPPSRFPRINGQVAARATNPTSPYVEFLLLHARRLPDPRVREALKLATDVNGWIAAGGGGKRYDRAYSVVAPDVPGHARNPAFDGPGAGHAAAARAMLRAAGARLPYPIRFAFAGGNPTQEAQARVLRDGWERAGFLVEVLPLPGRYHEVVQDPGHTCDVMWATWGADWPSAGTVLPAIFDHRINLTDSDNGQNYGQYRSETVAELLDEAASATTATAAQPLFRRVDEQLGIDVAYIPLGVAKLYLLRGSCVTGAIANPAMNMFPDLGSLGVVLRHRSAPPRRPSPAGPSDVPGDQGLDVPVRRE